MDAETTSQSCGRTTGFRRLPDDNLGCNLHILLLSCSLRCRRDRDSAQLRSRPSRVAGFSSKDRKEIPSGSKRQTLKRFSPCFFFDNKFGPCICLAATCLGAMPCHDQSAAPNLYLQKTASCSGSALCIICPVMMA